MNKYYVQCGLIKEMVLAYTPQQACILAFQRLDGPNLVGGIFKVSQRGFDFDEHNENENFIIGTEVIINLMILAAESDL